MRSKARIMEYLYGNSINATNLFPDFDGLAKRAMAI